MDFLKNLFKKMIINIIRKINVLNTIKKNNYLIFYHIPRSSGTSLKFFFRKCYGYDSFLEINDFKCFEKFPPSKKIFLGHKQYKEFNNLKKYEFTILRNPIDRLISQYYYLLNFDKAKDGHKISTNIIQSEKLNIENYTKLIQKYYSDNLFF